MRAETIREIPLFATLPEGEIRYLAESLEECSFQAGDIPLNEGHLTPNFYLILDGEVEIVKSLGTADERVVAVSTRGALLGEMGMFSRDGSHTASARARTALTMVRITFDQFDAILRRHPPLALKLLRLYSRRLEESESMTIQDLREKNRQLTVAYQELQAAQASMIEKEKLEHELQISAEIQRSILPEEIPHFTGMDFGALMIPARLVGGDFYDFIPLDEHRIGVVIGDVCDKGMPAALFMALTCSAVRSEAVRQDDPGKTLARVNQHLMQMNRTMMYVTLLYGVLDSRTSQFTYARAGHPAPLLLDDQDQPVAVPFQLGQPLGIFETPRLDAGSITIPPGGTMLLYSDGLSETVETWADAPTLPRLCADLLAGPSRSAQGLCNALWQTVSAAAERYPVQDDFTIVALRSTRAP